MSTATRNRARHCWSWSPGAIQGHGKTGRGLLRGPDHVWPRAYCQDVYKAGVSTPLYPEEVGSERKRLVQGHTCRHNVRHVPDLRPFQPSCEPQYVTGKGAGFEHRSRAVEASKPLEVQHHSGKSKGSSREKQSSLQCSFPQSWASPPLTPEHTLLIYRCSLRFGAREHSWLVPWCGFPSQILVTSVYKYEHKGWRLQ